MHPTLIEIPGRTATAVMSECVAPVTPTPRQISVASQPLTVTATCATRTGLHTDLLWLLSPYIDRGSEVIELRSKEFEAPMDSMMIFEATMSLHVRDGYTGADATSLLADIEALEPDMVVTVS